MHDEWIRRYLDHHPSAATRRMYASDLGDLALFLGRRLSVRVVAEGVENAHAWELLVTWRCDEAQGYFVGRPMSAPELATWLQRLPEHEPDLPDARLWAAMRP